MSCESTPALRQENGEGSVEAAAKGPRVLQRSMRVTGTLLLTLSSVTPASSVFVFVPTVIQEAGSGAFLSMIAAALLSLPIAFVYAELASAFPIAGGEYSMLGPLWGRAGALRCWG